MKKYELPQQSQFNSSSMLHGQCWKKIKSTEHKTPGACLQSIWRNWSFLECFRSEMKRKCWCFYPNLESKLSIGERSKVKLSLETHYYFTTDSSLSSGRVKQDFEAKNIWGIKIFLISCESISVGWSVTLYHLLCVGWHWEGGRWEGEFWQLRWQYFGDWEFITENCLKPHQSIR